LGIAYLFLGNYAKAIEYAQQYLAIAREIKNRKVKVWHWAIWESLTLALGGNYAKAIEYAQQSLAIAREIKDRHSGRVCTGEFGKRLPVCGHMLKPLSIYSNI
jgi:tetratricopeptide (TPR) repeat protein